ncbi:MAG: DUF2189 domain-containing protein [Rhodoferax sp.]|nr:DUF2189 domain-containing protein [Rhodoferax sp.]
MPPATPAQTSRPILGAVHTLPIDRPLHWLTLGWGDMRRCGWISVLHGLALAMFGAALLTVAHQRFWLLAGAFSGFLLMAPVLATSLYALSRALMLGEPANARVVVQTWLAWQREHGSKWGNDYWCMVQFGALLALAGTGWVVTSAALITLLAPVPISTPLAFAQHVVLAKEGYLFELWLMMGGMLAAPMFASTAVAMQLLLDRQVTLLQAVLTSRRAVLANPLPMALWAAIIMALTLIGFLTAMLGLIVVMPVLGHASWHAYCDLVDRATLPSRDAAATQAVLPGRP